MAHPAVETQLAQPAYEVTDAQHHKETGHTLRKFCKSTAALRTVLGRGGSFNDLELRLLENHFHVLQMAYRGTKRKLGA